MRCCFATCWILMLLNLLGKQNWSDSLNHILWKSLLWVWRRILKLEFFSFWVRVDHFNLLVLLANLFFFLIILLAFSIINFIIIHLFLYEFIYLKVKLHLGLSFLKCKRSLMLIQINFYYWQIEQRHY